MSLSISRTMFPSNNVSRHVFDQLKHTVGSHVFNKIKKICPNNLQCSLYERANSSPLHLGLNQFIQAL